MLSMSFYKPKMTADGSDVVYNPTDSWSQEIEIVADFTFTRLADGGYWEANFSLEGAQSDVESWVDDGVGRHVEIYSEGEQLIWEGFVNQVDANLGGLSVIRGPLLDICNRCSVRYARQEIVDTEIVTTQGLTTTVEDDEDSKLKYGIFEKILSGGTVWSSTEADHLRDTWLAENSRPETSKSFSTGAGNTSVSIACLGYIHLIGNYIFGANTADTDNISVPIYDPDDADSKLTKILELDPNNLFSDDSKWRFDTNMIAVPAWEDQDSDALSLIRTLLALGDGSDNRMLFWVGKDQMVYYKAVPTDLEYELSITDPKTRVSRPGTENEIFPWNVEAGKWLLFTDFLVGKTRPSNLRSDPRAIFIERMVYSTPWNLQLEGVKIGTAKQKMARMGSGV